MQDLWAIGLVTLLAVVLLGIVAALAGGHARRRWGRYRTIVDTERTRIGALSRSGLFEVRGKVMASDVPLMSPMSQQACVFYRFVVKERRTRSVGSGSKRRSKTEWVTVVADTQECDCVLSDGSGRVRVPLTHAERHFRVDHAQRSGFLDSPPEELRAMLMARYGKDTQGLLFNKALRYEETVVKAGDELYVLGEVKKDVDGFAFLRGAVDNPDASGPLLLVTDRGESWVRNHALWGAVGSGLVAALAGAGALAVIAAAIHLATQG